MEDINKKDIQRQQLFQNFIMEKFVKIESILKNHYFEECIKEHI